VPFGVFAGRGSVAQIGRDHITAPWPNSLSGCNGR
jgi:hypothetical protein